MVLSMKKKSKCKKGYNCGRTCISVKNACKVDGLTGQSVNIAGKLAEAIASTNKTKGYKPKAQKPSIPGLKSGEVVLNKTNNNLTVSSEYNGIKLEAGLYYDKSGTYEISFEVNGEYTESKSMDKDTRRAIASAVRYDLDRLMNNVPDGTTLYNFPEDEDGKGEKRIKLYKRVGFVMTDKYKMKSVKKDGRWVKPTKVSSTLSEENSQTIEELIEEVLFDD